MNEIHAAQCLSLPFHPQMGEVAADRVIAAINSLA